MAVAVITVCSFTGCTQQEKTFLNDVRDEVLPAYFTQEALTEIESVPMYMGEIPDDWALSVGDDWGSRLLAWVYGYGTERQVIMPYYGEEPRDPLVDSLIFHEYVHQADYEGLLSRDLFSSRLERMRDDPKYADVAEALDNLLDSLSQDPLGALANAYDDGLTREGMAYLIEFWADGCFDLPDYMLEVYERVVLPNPASRTDEYYDCYFFWTGFKLNGTRACCIPIHAN